ncbi:hypothetical protein Lser_V15G06546 [Lactuca serriola]
MQDKHEFTMQEGKRGGVWKNIARGGAALTLPLTASFPMLSSVIRSPPRCSPFYSDSQ